MTMNGLHPHPQITVSANPLPTRHFCPPLPAIRSCSTPPTSKEQAISQAKTCLSTTLQKPLLRFPGRRILKKPKQPRFRLEIPVFDESVTSLTELAFLIFGDLPLNSKASPVRFLLLWPTPTLAQAATQAFPSSSSSSPQLQQFHISSLDRLLSLDSKILNSTDVAVFLWPESTQIQTLTTVADALYPKPLVLFNPKWAFEEEEAEFGELGGFVGSFEVIYSFMGLEVQGIFSRTKGVVFKCVQNGVWDVLVEGEGGELKVVSKFKARPSISEVENVLYNWMAINSPITKSAKFLRDFVSNVTAKK